jgi:antirestriction protein ArdC
MYPLLSTGRFLMHTASHLVGMHEKLSKYDGMKTVARDARRLASAACFMESDIHCSPTQLIGAVRRFNANFPESYFQITDDSREIMQHMSKKYQAFLDTAAITVGRKSEVAFQEYLCDQTSFQEKLESNAKEV